MSGFGFRHHTSTRRLLVSLVFAVLVLFALLLRQSLFNKAEAQSSSLPNIVLIYMDDLGYGDVSCYGAKRLKTPNIDRLAKEGLRFTDGHSPAATCTPSRYALMTGEYAWRRKGTGVLPGDASLIIEPGRTTLPSILQKAGYSTGVVGKWHLGLGPPGGPEWNDEIKPNPNDLGFDYSYIMAATGDRVPTVYIENRRVVGLDAADPIKVDYEKKIGDLPTGRENPELLKMHPSHGHDMTIVNGVSRIGFMTGGKSALWKDEDMADLYTSKAISFIERNKNKSFFLYFATHDPHVPRMPHPRFAGKSGMGPRGDAILQADWCVGEILSALDRLKLARNTLIVFSSDNGPVVDDGYKDEAVEMLGTHKPAGPLRGGKYSNFEAGTRVPFIVRWPGSVKPGVSDALISQIDFLASFAAFTNQGLGDAAAPDSFNVMPALLGKSKTGREQLVEQASVLSLRIGQWKYIEPGKGPKIQRNTNTETGNDPDGQLYNLTDDLGETRNLISNYPDRAKEMAARLQQIRQNNRSRP